MITVIEKGDERGYSEDELPLAFGGAEAQLPVEGVDAGEALAWLDLRERDDGSSALFAGTGDSPEGRPVVLCNGTPLVRTTWLHPGDLLRAGSTLLRVGADGGSPTLTLESSPEDGPEAAGPTVAHEAGLPELIQPIPFVPRSATAPRRRRRRPRFGTVLVGLVLTVLVAAAVFLATARVVTVRVDPLPDQLSIHGGFLSWETDGRHLLLPGTHRLQASAEGHHDLDTAFVVGSEREQAFQFELEPLPGLLRLVLVPPGVRARVGLDDGEPEDFEQQVFELEAGKHALLVLAEGYLPHVAEVLVRGRSELQDLRVELVENAAELRVGSEPTGATLRIDGRRVGSTPLVIGLAAGDHELELSMPGRQSERRTIRIAPERDVDLGVIGLARSPGHLSLSSTPAGALVSVNGTSRGTTPLELTLPSERKHELRFSLAGHRPQSRSVRLAADARRSVALELEPLLGRVAFDVAPGGAELLVDGRSVGLVPESIELAALPHQLELRAAGHEPWTTSLTPDAENGSLVSVTLRTLKQAQRDARPSRIRNAAGLELLLVEPGEFRMGASRREPGRRSNEKLRSVKITRAFYLASTEVTNRQFQQFDSRHSSGVLSGYPLDGDDQPVVRVTWQQAARFCNWLSSAESLPLAYVEDEAGAIVGRHPLNAGYRLPTEAEWEWAARHAGGGPARRYSWGDQLPPRPGSANLADGAASALLPRVVAGYSDGQVVGAAVGSYTADRRGLSDMAGNVSEWAHDVYTIPAATTGRAVVDPRGPDTGELHSIRGSSFMHGAVTELRLSFRDYGKEGRPDLGFRVARFADQGEP